MAKKSPVRQFLPILLLGLGLVLIVGAGWLAFETHKKLAVQATGVPQSLAGFSISQQVSGNEAASQLKQMHLGDFEMQEAAIASYGQNNVTLWVAGAGSEDAAASLIQQMTDAILQGNTPFTPDSIYNFNGKDVYTLTGGNQLHFYFQSGDSVVWVAADDLVAEQALTEAMAFFP